ncbi:MAG: flippase-like domain-containing protein [Acidobacteria bacterium]|nr:flippase-like domain-containing protein [Acidobacteriota bacterium]
MHKYLKLTVLCLLAVLVLWLFARNLDWAEVSAAIRRADWRLIAAAVVLVWLTYLIRAFRWKTLLAPLAPRASLREAFAATTVGFGAIFLAGRAIGEVLRPAFLSLRDPEVRPGPAFVTIGVERLYDTVAVVFIFAANLLVFHAPGVAAGSYARVREAGLLMLVLAALGVAALVLFRKNAGAVIRWLNASSESLPAALGRAAKVLTGLLEQLAQTLGVLVDVRELLVTVGWTALLWATITLANMLVLRAFSLPIGVSETVFVLGWSLVGSLVPTPGGGAGTYHAATAYGLMTYLGVAETEAKAATIVLHLVVFGSALFFGLYYFLRSGVSFARLRSLATSNETDSANGRAARGTTDDEMRAGEARA